ncbi:WSC domain-containing protein [Tricladium varicosporioides]|nr:WSC domain-containing protein [Hymenoscyphus varicosporioides]
MPVLAVQVLTFPAVGGYNYYGCYTEHENGRLLAEKHAHYPGMTLERCSNECLAYKYFGVEFGKECYCGDLLAFPSVLLTDIDHQDCSMKCDGNDQEYCGAGMKLSLYGRVPPIFASTTSSSSFSPESTTASTIEVSLPTETRPPETTSEASPTFTSESPIEPTTSTPTTSSKADPTPVIQAIVGAYTYAGCWTDGVAHESIADWADSWSDMTLEGCGSVCDGYKYFGLQNGDKCYCANELAAASSMVADEECRIPCAGDSNEYCGDNLRVSLFQLINDSAPAPESPEEGTSEGKTSEETKPDDQTSIVDPFKFDGCYGDSAKWDSFGMELDHVDMTPELCHGICGAIEGAVVAGLHGSECWCSYALPETTLKAEDSSCSIVCPGDKTQNCGGNMAVTRRHFDHSDYLFSIWSMNHGKPMFSYVESDNSTSTSSINSSSSTSLSQSTSSLSSPSATPSSTSTSGSLSSSSLLDSSSNLMTGVSQSGPASSSGSVKSSPTSGSVSTTESSQSSASLSSSLVTSSSVPASSSARSTSQISSTLSTVLASSSTSATSTPLPGTAMPVGPLKPNWNSTAASATSAISFTQSTEYFTTTYTITSCGSTITDCPARIGMVTTEIIPITSISSRTASNSTAVPTQLAPLTPTPLMTISTVYTTSVYTVTSCAPTVSNCPAEIGKVVTMTIPLYTTVCPVPTIVTKSTAHKHHQSAKLSPSNPTRTPTVTSKARSSPNRRVSQKPSSVPNTAYTTVVTTSYVSICPTGLTTVTTSRTRTVTLRLSTLNPVKPTSSIPMTVTTRTITVSGSKITATLTIPRTTPARQSTIGSTNKASADSITIIMMKTFTVRPVKSTAISVYPLGNSTVPHGTWTASVVVKSTGTTRSSSMTSGGGSATGTSTAARPTITPVKGAANVERVWWSLVLGVAGLGGVLLL